MNAQDLANVIKSTEKALKAGDEVKARQLLASIPQRHAPMVMRVLRILSHKK